MKKNCIFFNTTDLAETYPEKTSAQTVDVQMFYKICLIVNIY